MNTPVAAPWVAHWQAPERSDAQTGTKWDLLLICIAGYVLTAVGRVHQLFPALELLRPAILTGLFAIVLILWAAPSLLTRWLRPALVFGDTMLGVVSGWVLPSAYAWVR